MKWLFYAVLVTVTAMVIGATLLNQAACEARGGVYLRGVFSYECVHLTPRIKLPKMDPNSSTTT